MTSSTGPPCSRCWLVIAAGVWRGVRRHPRARRCASAARCCARSPWPPSSARLLNPSFVREERERLKDVVAVVVDRSASQGLDDRAAQTDAVAAAVTKRLAGAARRRDPHRSRCARPAAARTAPACSRALQSGLVGRAARPGGGRHHDHRRRRPRHAPSRPPRWASRRRVHAPRHRPSPASATGASRCSTRRASASSARTRRSACASRTPARPSPSASRVRRDG